MSEEKQKWFVAERARALAMIHLTRRDDLTVVKAGQGLGLEFIVTVAKESGGALHSVSSASPSGGRKAP